ncbi:nitrate ABC transporter ATP-binding protein [Paenibacillus sp. 32O-W]|uniref:ABC transporter ATP-binding protein n=1 Tax=Paenibacillus sp. 32O-W TaxID=1695218 RepID=UPI00071EA861|nr:ABC transporter ATP-binding protein [Paenibacillus sp. 32O-W]ALS25811.1 nitrate ABC transporter ATP-binding protein [Paenibacillus sp. 32O-W]
MNVEVRQAGKTYRTGTAQTVEALRPITLNIRDREFVCFLGPSGCGKSTLLKLIAGIEPADSGEIVCDGVKVKGTSTDRGFIFQDYALFPWLTVKHNILFGLRARKENKQESHKIAESFIRLFGLSEVSHLYPNQLSGGMRQRVAIARALCLKPKLLLMDEPFAALDALLRQKLQEELVRIWSHEQITFVFVTHDVEEAVYLADRIVVMTPRPGTVKEIVPVNLPRPRNRTDADFVRLRARLLELMDNGKSNETWTPPPSWNGSMPLSGGQTPDPAGRPALDGVAIPL